jgi:hypothetical protein
MKLIPLSAALLVASAIVAQAQTAPAPTAPGATSTTSPLPAPQPNPDNNAPLPGANSFTEMQAKTRLEDNGFTGISGLLKDDKGVWRGTATYAGKQMSVAIDYRGNIVAN